MSGSEKAAEIFGKGYNCAQSVFAAFSDDTGIDERTACAAALGFGAGIGRQQLVCGAVSGAVMAIGAMFYDESDVAASKKLAYEKTRAFFREFEKRHGTTECMRLLGVDFTTPEGSDFANRHDLFTTKCTGYVRSACEIVDGLK